MLKPLGLYVHIPFCVEKCNYCDFNSYKMSCFPADVMEKYIDCVINEINTLKKHTEERFLDTIFIGGGTPSVLNNTLIKKLCDKIRRSFYIDDNVEWTIECNPGTVSLEDFKVYRECGINRISMGVQSLNEDELKVLGRIHGIKEFMEGYASIKIAGFENINFDIMFSLPGQNSESFCNTLEKILLYEPTHISAYSLQLEEGTRLYEIKDSLTFPSDEENREMYENAKKILGEKGYRQYEISNFAKEGYESRHNLKYWSQMEYIGLGAGASSYFNNVRYENPKDVFQYCDFSNKKELLFKENPPMTLEERMSEFMFMGLRKTEGIFDKDFRKMYNKSFFDVFKEPIERHTADNLLEIREDNLRLTSKGTDLANYVMCDFV